MKMHAVGQPIRASRQDGSGCCTPNNQIGLVDLSGVAFESSMYLNALSSWVLLCLATVKSKFDLVVLDGVRESQRGGAEVRLGKYAREIGR
jgi:hypothetical protein